MWRTSTICGRGFIPPPQGPTKKYHSKHGGDFLLKKTVHNGDI